MQLVSSYFPSKGEVMKMRGITVFTVLLVLAISLAANGSQVILNPTKDAGIWQSAPDDNYGSLDHGWVGWDNGWADTLIQFNLAPYMGTIVESAYLELYVYDFWGTSVPTSSWVDRVAGSWDEGTVTWNNSPGSDGSIWFYIGTPTIGDWFTFEVTSIVETWIDSSFTNNGFYLGEDDSSNFGYYFYSKEGADSGLHPKLELNYHNVSVQPTSLGTLKAIYK
jgi:hypothetical protein